MRLADNLDRHRVSDEFEFQPDQNIDFGVTCPLVPCRLLPVTYNGEYIVLRIATSFLIGASSSLQLTKTVIKSWTTLISGWIGLDYSLWSYSPLSDENFPIRLIMAKMLSVGQQHRF